MSNLMERMVAHLQRLVGFDTQNPPRAMDSTSPIFFYLREQLGEGFDVTVLDHGKGRVTLFACRGKPSILFNVHLDTVPAISGSLFPPLEMTIRDDRAYGRGVCDIKGAAACLLAIAEERRDDPLALLFTTDEEGGEGCCVSRFIESGEADAFRQVVVAEPTECRAELRHRGFLSARGEFTGISGHSSEARALVDNANHQLVHWCASALSEAQAAEANGKRNCFNIGTVLGGVKSNVIADMAKVFWSARLPPGESNDAFMDVVRSWPSSAHAQWTVSFSGPPLPTGANTCEGAESFAGRHGLDIGDGLDFWTEASLFAAAGIPALVLGPGSIKQAHAVDEWVALAQLERCFEAYSQLVQEHV